MENHNRDRDLVKPDGQVQEISQSDIIAASDDLFISFPSRGWAQLSGRSAVRTVLIR